MKMTIEDCSSLQMITMLYLTKIRYTNVIVSELAYLFPTPPEWEIPKM